MKKKIFFAIFIPIFILYAYTSPSTLYWQDSGIYLSGIKTLGVIYPPGFPLYVISAWIWTNVLGALLGNIFTFAKLVHLYSGLWGAATAGLVGYFVWEFTGQVGDKGEENKTSQFDLRMVVSIAVGLLSGLSYSLWAQSINAEVYSLAGFFGILMFGLIFRETLSLGSVVEIAGLKINKNLLLLVLIWGLSFANHPLTVTFAPVIIYLIYGQYFGKANKAKLVGFEKYGPLVVLGIVFVFFASIFYLYLPLRSSMNPPYLWNKIDSFQALINHIIGKEYFTREVSVTLFDKDKLVSFARLFWEEFLITIPILVYGLWKMARRRKTIEIIKIYFLYTITIYLVLFFYEGGTEYKFWLIPFYCLTWIIMGISLYKVLLKSNRRVVLGIILAIVSTTFLFVNWKYLNRKQFTLAQEFGKNLIGVLPQDSIIFTVGDQSSSIPQYLQFVEEYRRDVVLVWDTSFSQDWLVERMFNKYPNLNRPTIGDEDPFLVINNFIEENINERNIFLITKNVIPTKPGFGLIPAGTFWKLVKELEPINLSYWKYDFSDINRYTKLERPESARQVKDTEDKVVDIIATKYSDEAKNFEMQAYKNLADYCLAAYDLKGFVEVVGLDDETQKWTGGRLLECSEENYENMFKIDPDVSSTIVGSSIERVRALMQVGDQD